MVLIARGRIAAALLGALLLAGVASARPKRGAIRGRVVAGRIAAPPATRPSVAELGMPRPADPPDRSRSVVYLETAPQGAFEEPERAARVVLDQRNQAFVPFVLAVTVGTKVEFPNSDRTYHNVFSLSKTKRFDLGRYPRGQSRSVRFDRPGVVRVFCEIHSHMNAFVLVFAHRYFATTDSDGRFRIDDVPPGAYSVVIWNDGAEREKRQVRVHEDGDEAELDITLHGS